MDQASLFAHWHWAQALWQRLLLGFKKGRFLGQKFFDDIAAGLVVARFAQQLPLLRVGSGNNFLSGAGHLEQQGRYHRLTPGTVVCSDRGVIRQLWCEGDEEMLVNILALNACEETTERLADAMSSASIAYMATNGSAICGILDAMMQCAANHEPLAHGICNTCLYPLLLTIKQGCLFRETETNRRLSTYYRCQRYMDEHFAETASVDEVVRHHPVILNEKRCLIASALQVIEAEVGHQFPWTVSAGVRGLAPVVSLDARA